MSTAIHRQVDAARAGENPHVVCRVVSGWVVLSPWQYLRGYCLLLPDPVVPDLNVLDLADRTQYLQDMAMIGDVLLEVTDACRINYEILGNVEPALHAHMFPRYRDEPDPWRFVSPLSFEESYRTAHPFDAARDAALMSEIAHAVEQRLRST